VGIEASFVGESTLQVWEQLEYFHLSREGKPCISALKRLLTVPVPHSIPIRRKDKIASQKTKTLSFWLPYCSSMLPARHDI
jgi:hypothetical protein